ncbi:MAG TPA: carboxypeptidase-like regulatory domain-containing protein [Longimicrobium sp.]|jgi:hypothetical protein
MLKQTWSALVLATLVTLAACDGGNVFGSTRVPSGGNGTRGTISGQVQAGGSGLGGVTVLLGTADSTVTNTAGTFTFINLLPATYNLVVRVPLGYAPAAGETGQRTITVSAAGGTATASFALQRTATGAF